MSDTLEDDLFGDGDGDVQVSAPATTAVATSSTEPAQTNGSDNGDAEANGNGGDDDGGDLDDLVSGDYAAHDVLNRLSVSLMHKPTSACND